MFKDTVHLRHLNALTLFFGLGRGCYQITTPEMFKEEFTIAQTDTYYWTEHFMVRVEHPFREPQFAYMVTCLFTSKTDV